jgi:hypothetical protein
MEVEQRDNKEGGREGGSEAIPSPSHEKKKYNVL